MSTVNGHEVELDQHTHTTRQLSALLSAALAAAQTAAQISAQRARGTAQRADQQARQAEQAAREQVRVDQLQAQAELAAQRQAERQQRAAQTVQHRQWSLKPTAQWLHDKPLSAAAAWASADVHREQDPIAARHADQWEAIFKQEGVHVDQVRADAPAAVAAAGQEQPSAPATALAEPAEAAGELAAAEVAAGAVLAGVGDVDHAEATGRAADPAAGAGSRQWSAYADGAEAAALGGRGVSTPPNQVLAKSRQTPDVVAAAAQASGRDLELINTNGVER